ncbi:MAG TPA: nucleotidyltransferase family protein [Opitutaceae bacterium]|jgi:CTP:molybdopterin cytidylyltransferase MocA|nr:nucleotidyltransferase family protein [Opitutaceae bacterium]
MAEPAAEPLRFGCLVLAAGASTRMGSPKQLLPVGGEPLVARAAGAALASPAWPVVVVLGSGADGIRPALARLPVLAVENPAWAEGMASSIRAGLAALRQFSPSLQGVVVALCDHPAFSAAAIVRLAEAQRASGRSIAAARYGGRCGAPALFLREHFAALSRLTGEDGARAFLNAEPGRVAAVDLPEFAVDLDTPEDYRRYLAAP